MKRLRIGVIAAVVLASILAAGSFGLRTSEGAADEPPPPLGGKALVVFYKAEGYAHVYLTEPEVRQLGNQTFLTGHLVGSTVRKWISLREVRSFDAYENVDALRTAYGLPAAP
jgi:hypothetical protein